MIRGPVVALLLLLGVASTAVQTWSPRVTGSLPCWQPVTSFWHYTNIPPDAAAYDRDRDCPRQPGVAAGGRGDRWRDCVVDRIAYSQERLSNASLDCADRAIALKFLVHLVGDLHQPFHALGVERGGNGIPVAVFGSPACNFDDGTAYPCNLHGVWDTALIAHRRLGDEQYLQELERQNRRASVGHQGHRFTGRLGNRVACLAKAALVPPRSKLDEAYYRSQISVIDERLALGGLRLAAWLNQSLAVPPPAR